MFNKLNSLVLLFTVFLFACNEEKIVNKQFEILKSTDQDSTLSYFSEKEGNILVENNFFLPYSYTNDNYETELFVFKVKENASYKEDEKIKKSLFSPVFSNQSIKDWEIESTADKYELSRSFIQFEYFGNAKKESFFEIYNIHSGNKVIGYSYGKLDIIYPSEEFKRTIGFHSKRAIVPLETKRKNYLGYFTYADKNGAVKKIHISTLNDILFNEADKSTPVLELIKEEEEGSGLMVNNNRGIYFSENPIDQNNIDFKFQATFYFGESYDAYIIKIPIKQNDVKMDLIEYDSSVFSIEIE